MTLEERIITLLMNNMERKIAVTLESRLKEDLKLDSLDRLMIVNALEDEFGIAIEMEDFSEVQSVQDIVNKFK